MLFAERLKLRFDLVGTKISNEKFKKAAATTRGRCHSYHCDWQRQGHPARRFYQTNKEATCRRKSLAAGNAREVQSIERTIGNFQTAGGNPATMASGSGVS